MKRIAPHALRLAGMLALIGLLQSASAATLPKGDGTDYYFPNPTITGSTISGAANGYTWLQAADYTNSAMTSTSSSFPTCKFGTSPQTLLGNDLSFIRSNGIGNFHRVWISLDSLFVSPMTTTGSFSYDSTALANVDDALHQFAAKGIKTDIVLLANGGAAGTGFQFEALDGNHSAMATGYKNAVTQFLQHVAADKTDCAAIAVVDLLNEAYYQAETYLSTYGCSCSPNTSSCQDGLIHSFLQSLYTAAHAAAPNFLYTVSDIGRLLDTNHTTQQTWESYYNDVADVFDIHCYNDTPGTYSTRWATGLTLETDTGKRWFAGECGCSPGDTSCTYQGTTDTVDHWWLNNLPADGCDVVCIEEADTTAWNVTYPGGCTYSWPPTVVQVGTDIETFRSTLGGYYAPVVTGASPSSGAASGGTSVTITGSGFTGVTGASGVTFEGVPAASYTVNSDTQITAVSPAYNGNMTTDIRVTNPNGTSYESSADTYTFTGWGTPYRDFFTTNAGGSAAGFFAADNSFSGGTTSSTTATIDTSAVAYPAPQAVYQTERNPGTGTSFTYTVQGLTPGQPYTVRLHFAEIYWTSAGKREFNVSINSTQVLTNFDIYATAGAANKAVTERFAAVADGGGKITIVFTDGAAGNAAVMGIEVINYFPYAQTNAGGSAVSPFAADSGYSTGSTTFTSAVPIDTSAVTYPAPTSVYQTERNPGTGSSFTYTVTGLTPNATYSVRLHFAELYWTSSGQREFNVSINGTQVLTNYDIYASAGGANKAIIDRFQTNADGTGQIAIVFTNGAVGHACVCGIEVISPLS